MHRHPLTARIWRSARWWLAPGIHEQHRHVVAYWDPTCQVVRAAADSAMSLDDFARFFIAIKL